jgi:hypothetical protein
LQFLPNIFDTFVSGAEIPSAIPNLPVHQGSQDMHPHPVNQDSPSDQILRSYLTSK